MCSCRKCRAGRGATLLPPRPETPRRNARTSTPACTTPRSSWAFHSTGRFSAPNHNDLLLHRSPLARTFDTARGSFAHRTGPGGGNMWARPQRRTAGIAMTDHPGNAVVPPRQGGTNGFAAPMPGPNTSSLRQTSLRVVLQRGHEGLHAAGPPPAPMRPGPSRRIRRPGTPERAGLLAGRPCVDDRGPFILSEGVMPAGRLRPTAVSALSTAWDSWRRHAAALPRRDRRGLVHRPTGQGRALTTGTSRSPPLFPDAHHLRHRPRPGEAGSVPLVRRPAAAATRFWVDDGVPEGVAPSARRTAPPRRGPATPAGRAGASGRCWPQRACFWPRGSSCPCPARCRPCGTTYRIILAKRNNCSKN